MSKPDLQVINNENPRKEDIESSVVGELTPSKESLLGLKGVPGQKDVLGLHEMRKHLEDLLEFLQDDKIEMTGPSLNFTVPEALLYVMRENPSNVLILYYDEDGEITTRSSRMNRADALFMVESAKMNILNIAKRTE